MDKLLIFALIGLTVICLFVIEIIDRPRGKKPKWIRYK